MNKLKRFILQICFFLFISLSVFCENSESKVLNSLASVAFADGCRSYSAGDWETAVILLKKAAGFSENLTSDTYYMLINAELKTGENEEALSYCDYFLYNFPNSDYIPRVKYLKGRILFNLQEYERSVIELSDFCHQYENDEMYANALFYIAESMYDCYQYDEACLVYERIVSEFSDSEKAVVARYRLESVAQRSREEKLLYLLKQTGEEYLSAKEEYEKQLRLNNSESVYTAKQKLQDTKDKNAELERQVLELEAQIDSLNQEVSKIQDQRDDYAQQVRTAQEERKAFEEAALKSAKEKAELEAIVNETSRANVYAPYGNNLPYTVNSQGVQGQTTGSVPYNTQTQQTTGNYPYNAGTQQITGSYPYNTGTQQTTGSYPYNTQTQQTTGNYPYSAGTQQTTGSYPYNAGTQQTTGNYPYNAQTQQTTGSYQYNTGTQQTTGNVPYNTQTQQSTGSYPYNAGTQQTTGNYSYNTQTQQSTGNVPYNTQAQQTTGNYPYNTGTQQTTGNYPYSAGTQQTTGSYPYNTGTQQTTGIDTSLPATENTTADDDLTDDDLTDDDLTDDELTEEEKKAAVAAEKLQSLKLKALEAQKRAESSN